MSFLNRDVGLAAEHYEQPWNTRPASQMEKIQHQTREEKVHKLTLICTHKTYRVYIYIVSHNILGDTHTHTHTLYMLMHMHKNSFYTHMYMHVHRAVEKFVKNPTKDLSFSCFKYIQKPCLVRIYCRPTCAVG